MSLSPSVPAVGWKLKINSNQLWGNSDSTWFYPLIFTDLDPKRLSLHRTSLRGTSRTCRHLRPRLPWASEIDLLKVHHSPVSILYFTFLYDSKMIFKPQVLVIHAPWQSSLKISQALRVQGSPMSHVPFQTQMEANKNKKYKCGFHPSGIQRFIKIQQQELRQPDLHHFHFFLGAPVNLNLQILANSTLHLNCFFY